MILPIQHVIPDTLLRRLLTATHNENLFRDGARTAGWYARSRKQNLQAEGGTLQNSLSAVARHVLTHEVVQAAARPASIVRQVVSRYDEGMHYDTHVAAMCGTPQRGRYFLTWSTVSTACAAMTVTLRPRHCPCC